MHRIYNCQPATSIDLSRFTESERRLLRTHKEAKRTLETKIERLQKEILQAEWEVVDAQRRYGEVYNSRSALCAVPNEILATIFRELLRLTRATGVPQNPLAEVAITHVCGLWRRLALSTPSVWNAFYYDGSLATRIPLDRLEAYLERSGSYPLELWFNFTGSGEGWEVEHLKLLKLASPHIHRCRVFQVLSDNDTSINELQQILQNASAPMLEHLAICPDQELNSDQQTLMQQWIPNIFLPGTPSLAYLRLDETSFESFRPSFTSVVQLRLEKRAAFNPNTMDQGIFDQILNLPHLEALSVWGYFIAISRAAHNARGHLIKARRLKNCRLDGTSELLLPYFLSHVSAPLLETLTMASIFLHEPLITRDVDLFPSLHTLAIVRPVTLDSIAVANLIDYMSVTKNIKRFVFSAYPTIPFLAERFAERVSPDLKARLQETWSNVEEATINVISRALHVSYKPCAYGFRNLKTLRIPKASVGAIQTNEQWAVEWSSLQESIGFTIEAIDEGDPILPFYWPPGSDWLDTEPDPFLTACPLNVSTIRLITSNMSLTQTLTDEVRKQVPMHPVVAGAGRTLPKLVACTERSTSSRNGWRSSSVV